MNSDAVPALLVWPKAGYTLGTHTLTNSHTVTQSHTHTHTEIPSNNPRAMRFTHSIP